MPNHCAWCERTDTAPANGLDDTLMLCPDCYQEWFDAEQRECAYQKAHPRKAVLT